jgi:hypothetical protein
MTVSRMSLAAGAVNRQAVHIDRRRTRMDQLRAAVIATALGVTVGLVGCEKGPAQKAGERIDRITDQDKPIGKGPAEKAGKKVDDKVDDIKK